MSGPPSTLSSPHPVPFPLPLPPPQLQPRRTLLPPLLLLLLLTRPPSDMSGPPSTLSSPHPVPFPLPLLRLYGKRLRTISAQPPPGMVGESTPPRNNAHRRVLGDNSHATMWQRCFHTSRVTLWKQLEHATVMDVHNVYDQVNVNLLVTKGCFHVTISPMYLDQHRVRIWNCIRDATVQIVAGVTIKG